jgi:hypothetical protein
MTHIVHLAPHDPIPAPGAHGLVLRRLGEDDPNAVVTEIVFHGPDGGNMAAVHADGTAMSLEQAVTAARALAEQRHIHTVFVLDRTGGPREQEVLHDHGGHNFPGDTLSDTDQEDGVHGSDLRDRPHDAGFMR